MASRRTRPRDAQPIEDEPEEVPRCTLDEVGRKFGISKEAVRRSEQRAFAKLWKGLQEIKMSELLGPDSVI